MALISVIIPAFNPGRFLEIAVRSVLAQTFEDWEIVIMDDGSTEALLPFGEWDARIRVLRQENKGQSVARNAAITQSSGEFVAFLDADDEWLPQKLARQLEVMQSDPKLGLCHTQFEMVDGENRRINHGYGGLMNTYLWLLDGCGVGVSSVMVRRTVLQDVGGFDALAAPCDDYEMWLRIARFFPIAGIDEILMLYRIHGTNMSLNYEVMFAASNNILEKHRLAAIKNNDRRAQVAAREGQRKIARVYGSQGFDRVRESVRHRDFLGALPHWNFALRHSPVFVAQSLLSFALRKK